MPPTPKARIIQIVAFPATALPPADRLYALCEDGTLWTALLHIHAYGGVVDVASSRIPSEGTMWQQVIEK